MASKKFKKKKKSPTDTSGQGGSQKKRKPNPSIEATTVTESSSSPSSETWSKSKKKRMRAMKTKLLKKEQQGDNTSSEKTSSNSQQQDNSQTEWVGKLSKLQDSFKARLSGSRFRILNEELYTKKSTQSFDRFSKNPELFEEYHEGFRHQVASWPVNPVDSIVRWIRSKKSTNTVVVADFGCGDAQVAKDLLKIKNKNGNNAFKVHSFDLVSQNEMVTACDMAKVPLEDESVDVVVFCLALMGTNLADFIREAHRVLKDNGKVKIAEVRSRIEYSHSNKGTQGSNDTLTGTLKEFVQVLSKLGFECDRTDRSNKMFLFLELKKNEKKPDKKLEFSAKPCIYKRR